MIVSFRQEIFIMYTLSLTSAKGVDPRVGLHARPSSHFQPVEREHARGEGQAREKDNRREAKSDPLQTGAVVEDLLESEHPVCRREDVEKPDRVSEQGEDGQGR